MWLETCFRFKRLFVSFSISFAIHWFLETFLPFLDFNVWRPSKGQSRRARNKLVSHCKLGLLPSWWRVELTPCWVKGHKVFLLFNATTGIVP